MPRSWPSLFYKPLSETRHPRLAIAAFLEGAGPLPTTTMSAFSSDGVALRAWVLITGLASLGAAMGAYAKPLSPHKTLYKNTTVTANAAFARMYATWLLTSTTIRIAFAAAENRSPSEIVFWLAFGTYGIALMHFVLELFVFRTAALLPGGVMPVIVASASLFWFTAIVMGLL